VLLSVAHPTSYVVVVVAVVADAGQSSVIVDDAGPWPATVGGWFGHALAGACSDADDCASAAAVAVAVGGDGVARLAADDAAVAPVAVAWHLSGAGLACAVDWIGVDWKWNVLAAAAADSYHSLGPTGEKWIAPSLHFD